MGNELSRHVVGYARVSTRDQDLTSQVERIQKYISDYGLIPAIEGAIFQEKMSGASNTRPERAKILKLAEQGKVDLVICTKLDRWGRYLKDLPEKAIIQRYRNGETIKSLASEYRISPTTIKKRLILRNVAVRTLKA